MEHINSGAVSDWGMTPKLNTALTDSLYVLGGSLSPLYVSAPLPAFFPRTDYTVFLSSLSWLQRWLPATIPPMREESWHISQYSTAGSRRNRIHVMWEQHWTSAPPCYWSEMAEADFHLHEGHLEHLASIQVIRICRSYCFNMSRCLNLTIIAYSRPGSASVLSPSTTVSKSLGFFPHRKYIFSPHFTEGWIRDSLDSTLASTGPWTLKAVINLSWT